MNQSQFDRLQDKWDARLPPDEPEVKEDKEKDFADDDWCGEPDYDLYESD